VNRKILIQVTTPAVLIGLLLFGTCLAGASYVSRLQSNLARVLSENVTSQKAAQELEIGLRQLQYHTFLYMMDPTPNRRHRIDEDHEALEAALEGTQDSARTPEQEHWFKEIKTSYQRYNQQMDELVAKATKVESPSDLVKLADTHPLKEVVQPAHELLELDKEMMKNTSEESQRVAQQGRTVMILVGLVGPIGGLIAGFGIARGLSRSIYQLSVRVRDMAQSLEQDVASVSIEADGDLQTLDRQLQHVVGRVEEVAERQQRHQREMLRAEQLASVGQLAAGVAHEIRNPLTAVKMLVEVALRSENRKPLRIEDLRVIHGEIVRLEKTVQGLLDFARLPELVRCEYDLRQVVAEAIDLVRLRAHQQKVEIAVKCPNDPVLGCVDHVQLRTVLVNLLLNALDAMPQGGHLQVSLESSPVTGLRLCVEDTGTGIPPDIADRLFTPFVTTKETGTGLGLSLSRRIVEEHGGRLLAANRPTGGACFTISLPAGALANASG
jgi:two-component system, NtrC family, sensor histidine kinase HydH